MHPTTVSNPSTTMSSLEIAKLTGKRHNDVLRDIRNTFEQAGLEGAQFCAHQRNPQNGQEYPVYQLPRAECDLVISGYSVKYRWAIIQRWHELEKQAAPSLPSNKQFHEDTTGRLMAASCRFATAQEMAERMATNMDGADDPAQGFCNDTWAIAYLIDAGKQAMDEATEILLHLTFPRSAPAVPPAPTFKTLPTAAQPPGVQWSDPAKAEEVLKSMRFKLEEMYDFTLITPARVEAMHRSDVIGPRQYVKLKALMRSANA